MASVVRQTLHLNRLKRDSQLFLVASRYLEYRISEITSNDIAFFGIVTAFSRSLKKMESYPNQTRTGNAESFDKGPWTQVKETFR